MHITWCFCAAKLGSGAIETNLRTLDHPDSNSDAMASGGLLEACEKCKMNFFPPFYPHIRRLFGNTGMCAACNKVIPAFEMVMRARNNVYHLECFACQQCNHRYALTKHIRNHFDHFCRAAVRANKMPHLRGHCLIKFPLFCRTVGADATKLDSALAIAFIYAKTKSCANTTTRSGWCSPRLAIIQC